MVRGLKLLIPLIVTRKMFETNKRSRRRKKKRRRRRRRKRRRKERIR